MQAGMPALHINGWKPLIPKRGYIKLMYPRENSTIETFRLFQQNYLTKILESETIIEQIKIATLIFLFLKANAMGMRLAPIATSVMAYVFT